jgi:hypothetical protein
VCTQQQALLLLLHQPRGCNELQCGSLNALLCLSKCVHQLHNLAVQERAAAQGSSQLLLQVQSLLLLLV